MIKLFNSNDTLFSSNGDKIIIPTKAKIHKEDNVGVLNVTNVLTKGEQTVATYGIIRKVQANIYDYTIYASYIGLIYQGRINNGSITSCFKVTGSNVS